MTNKVRCGINDVFGGGVFVCGRPVVPDGNGSYCAYHGGWPHNKARLELTWRAWFLARFVYGPRNVLLHIRGTYWKLRLRWAERLVSFLDGKEPINRFQGERIARLTADMDAIKNLQIITM